MADNPLWQPTADAMHKTAMWKFMQSINQQYALDLDNYNSLHQWSIDDPARFWEKIWGFCGIKTSQSYSNALINKDTMQEAIWFKGSRLNFAENLLRHCIDENKHKLVIIFQGENRIRKELNYSELYNQVASIATALKAFGVKPGDRIAGYLPNLPETIVAMLATTSLGAIWSSCSPDFGLNGVIDRFSQIQPKVLFTADGYFFKGKTIERLNIVEEMSKSLNSLSAIVIIPYISTENMTKNIPKSHYFNSLLTQYSSKEISFEQLPFNHPLYIMFSSGTTGVPKCIVHGAGGTLIQHLKELILHVNLSYQDRFFYFTTCGWMMWNWLVSGLATGASIILYDGSPFYPNKNILMDLIDQNNITVFGTSAKYLSALQKKQSTPLNTHKLTNLRCILSTGSPLSPESFDYVYNGIKKDLQLCSISGGTDILSCFALGSPILPVYRGELQCRGLGLDVDVYNDQGQSILKEKGELVCKSPFPSMPIYFWNDKNKEKYSSAYFKKFKNTWAQGDYAEITHHNGIIIYGRSDAILNPGGVRIGTAEIYRQVEKLPEILESIVVGQNWDNDIRVILFVRLSVTSTKKFTLDDDLKQKICNHILKNTTPRHVPSKIIQVSDIPRTISGKITELAVRNIIHHQEVKNIDALANPEALNHFRNLIELETE